MRENAATDVVASSGVGVDRGESTSAVSGLPVAVNISAGSGAPAATDASVASDVLIAAGVSDGLGAPVDAPAPAATDALVAAGALAESDRLDPGLSFPSSAFSGEAQRILALLDDEKFVRLRMLADRDVLLRSRLSEADLPEGFDADETWAILTSIRRQTASSLPWQSYLDIGYSTDAWYTISKSMFFMLSEIGSKCCVGSDLDKAVREHAGANDLLEPVQQELSLAFSYEGMQVSPEKIGRIILGFDQPENGLETVVKNVAELMGEEDFLAKRKVTAGFVESLYWRLMEGVDELPESSRYHPYTPIRGSLYEDPEASMRIVCAIAGDGWDDQLYHPVLRAFSVDWFFRDFSPVASLNAVVDFVLRRILFVKWGYPVLKWVRFSAVAEDWMNGHLDDCPSGLPAYWDVHGDALVDCGYGLDTTNSFWARLKLCVGEVTGLEKRVERLEKQSRQIAEKLEQDAFINHRQISILLNAAQSPSLGQKIEPHRSRFRVSYATARADFFSLAERGYLVKRQEGRTFVFYPGERVSNLVADFCDLA